MRLLAECGGVKATVVETVHTAIAAFSSNDALAGARTSATGSRTTCRDPQRGRSDDTRRSADQHPTRRGRAAAPPALQLLRPATRGPEYDGRRSLAALRVIAATIPAAPGSCCRTTWPDKKHSQLNMLATRGRRVVAEAVIRRSAGRASWASTPPRPSRCGGVQHRRSCRLVEQRSHAAQRAGGAVHRPPAGRRECRRSHAGVVYNQLLPGGDYYWSITLPLLIVGTLGAAPAWRRSASAWR